ncbi:ornithine--oxo-acid transaminase [candidate division WOR-3 bacterium]|nr:ornithine--oxo-acid transaminase [candidate division WOR-3 bacterium]
MNSSDFISQAQTHSARNYEPLPIVLARGEGVWVWDVEGRKYMDMLSSYSALNQGHRHPKVLKAMTDQMARLCLTSRAFHHDTFGPFCETITRVCRMDQVLLMNTGAEAVETAIKAARRWGYRHKKVEPDRAEIIVCNGNFHGRTTTIVGFSSEELYREGFGPFGPGFRMIPYDDAAALEQAVTPNTVAFLVEPIQGEAGIKVPRPGYLAAVRRVCTERAILLMLDEIQTGFGRTGRLFCADYEDARPDVLIVGKALGGGCFPVSGALASKEIMSVFTPGNHGSTFGGNPLACAVGKAAVEVIVEENLPGNAFQMGEYLRAELAKMNSKHVAEIRGKGLLVGVELRPESGPARPFCEKLGRLGVLAKETHGTIIRLAPPLVIRKDELDWALERIEQVLKG